MHEASATRTSGTKLAERTRADLHRAIPSARSYKWEEFQTQTNSRWPRMWPLQFSDTL